jgi:hypothetical protein
VVFENEFFQLIEYKPLTAKVYEKPFLLVPPCINKFYILDLQPNNSFIRYAVSQGHRTFVVSWRNPDESMAQKSWDDYIENAAIKAISQVQDITGAKQINALGFCVGGTILSNALAVLAARGKKPVASATFLTTLIDFTDTSSFAKCKWGRVVCSKVKTWHRPSVSCAPTIWFGTMWWAITSKVNRPHHLTCSTGTAIPPTCQAPSMLGICATPIWKTNL